MGLLYILLALLVLLMMVTIHEFGHYVAGKLLGFKINEFSIGFGLALFKKTKKSGKIFSIRLIPLGGYCAFEGEETDSESSGAFMKQKPWKRLIVLFNGAFFNFISAIIFCFIMLVSVGYDIPKINTIDQVVRVDSVKEVLVGGGYSIEEFAFNTSDKIKMITDSNGVVASFENGISPNSLCSVMSDASKYTDDTYTITFDRENQEKSVVMYISTFTNNGAGDNYLQPDDVVWKVNGKNIDFIKDNTLTYLISKVAENNNTITLTIERNGETKEITLNLYETGFKDADGNYAKAIGTKSSAHVFTVGEALTRCVPYTFGFSWKVLQALGQLVTGQVGLNEVGGPVYTISTIANLSRQSVVYFLTLLPLLSANLAIFNWLPFPALDGSKMLFTTIEWIRKKPLFSQKTENLIHTIGFFILIGFVLLADGFHLFSSIFG